uniref:Uncharacterized protein n=1 Tax=viral metagenome TaxID=1070528 RepID=A0A2V0RI46_9ZZZZ
MSISQAIAGAEKEKRDGAKKGPKISTGSASKSSNEDEDLSSVKMYAELRSAPMSQPGGVIPMSGIKFSAHEQERLSEDVFDDYQGMKDLLLNGGAFKHDMVESLSKLMKRLLLCGSYTSPMFIDVSSLLLTLFDTLKSVIVNGMYKSDVEGIEKRASMLIQFFTLVTPGKKFDHAFEVMDYAVLSSLVESLIVVFKEVYEGVARSYKFLAYDVSCPYDAQTMYGGPAVLIGIINQLYEHAMLQRGPTTSSVTSISYMDGTKMITLQPSQVFVTRTDGITVCINECTPGNLKPKDLFYIEAGALKNVYPRLESEKVSGEVRIARKATYVPYTSSQSRMIPGEFASNLGFLTLTDSVSPDMLYESRYVRLASIVASLCALGVHPRNFVRSYLGEHSGPFEKLVDLWEHEIMESRSDGGITADAIMASFHDSKA